MERAMSRFLRTAIFILLATTAGLAQDATPAQPAASDTSAASATTQLRGVIPTTLAKSIDSKKLKEGDEVTVKTTAALQTSSGIMMPTGTKIVGHVTQAKARSKGDPESSLGIAFDKVQVGGKDIPIKGTLQAVGLNPNESGPDTGAAGGGTMAAHGGDPTTMASPVSSAGPNAGQQQSGKQSGTMLNGHSTGVVGIKNMQLENSVLISSGKEVKLDQGAQMLIKAE